jgi:hypothetical protein
VAGFRYPPSARHTYRHCETIVTDPVPASADVTSLTFTNSFRFSMEGDFRADRHGCPLFHTIISDIKDTDRGVFKSYLSSQSLKSFPRREVRLPILCITLDLSAALDGLHSASIK